MLPLAADEEVNSSARWVPCFRGYSRVRNSRDNHRESMSTHDALMLSRWSRGFLCSELDPRKHGTQRLLGRGPVAR
jgi:hypothetical protein